MTHRVVNVASVPQRSPFRYPGGKTWLVPLVRTWLHGFSRIPERFIEPFVGGGIISLTVAFESLASTVIAVELDEEIASVWKVMLGKDAHWLANQIVTFKLTADSVKKELSQTAHNLRGRAFQTILKNRVCHGGIIAPGSGLMRHGENGRGIGSRWYPATLQKRILDIDAIKDRMMFIEGDGMKILDQYRDDPGAAFFIDPPYTAAGKRAGARLYKYNELDHERLFAIAASLRGNFIVTYDDTREVRRLAIEHGLDTEVVPMKNTHHAKMTELIISRNLDWLRRGAYASEQSELPLERVQSSVI